NLGESAERSRMAYLDSRGAPFAILRRAHAWCSVSCYLSVAERGWKPPCTGFFHYQRPPCLVSISAALVVSAPSSCRSLAASCSHCCYAAAAVDPFCVARTLLAIAGPPAARILQSVS